MTYVYKCTNCNSKDNCEDNEDGWNDNNMWCFDHSDLQGSE